MMADSDVIVGIDLGTTNSLVAVVQGGHPRILPIDGSPLLPSVVGVDERGQRIIGQTARNQYVAAPERTVRSIKRHMGEPGYRVRLGDAEYTPEEISAFILRRLADAASEQLGVEVRRVVITIPAYFADRQRQATMRAGELAGLEVVRLLHEPTAAALVYGMGKADAENALVYDLGGGTFDVSVVEVGAGLTEVRASHGNRQLGGDDFDQLIVDELVRDFEAEHKVDLRRDKLAMARLVRAAEAAKIHLSDHPYVEIREEFLTSSRHGRPLHLEAELSRDRFEELIEPHLLDTLEAVRRALKDSQLDPRALDSVLLVGGSTRIPAVRELISKDLGREPRQDIHPDEAVALGAAVQAAAIAGEDVDSVLVDVCPHSLGIRAISIRGGVQDDDAFVPLIHRNTVIPVSKSEFFYTVTPEQSEVDIEVFQGEEPVASRNTHLGDLTFTGLSKNGDRQREVLVAFDYDVNGILHVAAIDRKSGKRTEAHLHTVSLEAVAESAAAGELSTLLSRLRKMEGDDLSEEVRSSLQTLIAQGEDVAAVKDSERIDAWQEQAADFLLDHGGEY